MLWGRGFLGSHGTPYAPSIATRKSNVLKASSLGVLLYFAAGLLPGPDGPFRPETQNWYSWILAMCLKY